MDTRGEQNLFRAMNGKTFGREYHYNMAEGDENLGVQLLNDNCKRV
jgi:hypothetical protein